MTKTPAPTLQPLATRTLTPTPTATPIPSPTWTPAPPPEPTATPTPFPASAGEFLQAGDLAMSVVLRPTPELAPESENGSTPGRRFVLVDVIMPNTGDKLVASNSAREFILKDSADQIYKISARAVAAAGDVTPDINLAPGETIEAQAGFEVPQDVSGLVLTFLADQFSAGKIVFRLP